LTIILKATWRSHTDSDKDMLDDTEQMLKLWLLVEQNCQDNYYRLSFCRICQERIHDFPMMNDSVTKRQI
jgi:hypothetical protein